MSKASPNSDTGFGDLFGFRAKTDTAPLAKKRKPKKGNPAKRPSTPKSVSRFLSIDEVAQRYGVSHATIWRWVKNDKHFPEPIKLSPGTSRWSENQLLEFENRAALRRSSKETNLVETEAEKPTKGVSP